GAVLVLRALSLTGDDDAGRDVREAHGRARLVDVLTAGARSAVGIGPHVLIEYLDFDVLVDLWIDPHAGERGVPAGVGIVRADAHEPMHAGFGLQPAISVFALHQDGRGLDAGGIARLL